MKITAYLVSCKIQSYGSGASLLVELNGNDFEEAEKNNCDPNYEVIVIVKSTIANSSFNTCVYNDKVYVLLLMQIPFPSMYSAYGLDFESNCGDHRESLYNLTMMASRDILG